MSGDQLEQVIGILTRRQPFHSFEIEMATGTRLLVSHPEAIVREGHFFVYRGTNSGIHIFTASGVCQVIDLPYAPAS